MYHMAAPTEETVLKQLGPELRRDLSSGGIKWTAKRWQLICTAGYVGMSLGDAAALAQIARDTLVTWRQEYPGLQASWDYWVAHGTSTLAVKVTSVGEAMDSDGTMALKLLERRNKNFRPPAKQIEVTGQLDTSATIVLENFDGTIPKLPGPDDK